MFILSTLEDDVRVQPADLSKKPVDAVTDVLQATFVDKVIHGLGLVVTIYDIQSIEGGFVYPNDGCAFFKVKFRLVVLRPFVGEVIVGHVVSSDKSGVKVSLGFFDDIAIPEDHLQDPSFFDEATKEWFWDYEENRLPMSLGEEVRFRVSAVKFNTEPTPEELSTAKGDAKLLGTAACPFKPMEIIGDINEDGLGMTAWWLTAGDTMEE